MIRRDHAFAVAPTLPAGPPLSVIKTWRLLELLNQEILFFQLGALHLVPHPDRRHAAPGPLQLRILLRLILRRGLRSPSGTRFGNTRRSRSCGAPAIRIRVTAKPSKLALKIRTLFFDLRGQRLLQAGDVAAELRHIQLSGGAGELGFVL